MTNPVEFIALDLTRRVPALQVRDGTKLANQAKRLEPAIAETLAALEAEGYEVRRKAPPPSGMGAGKAAANPDRTSTRPSPK